MSAEEPWRAKLQENPLLSKLTDAGVSDSSTYWGYVGRSSKEGWLSLHPSLQDPRDTIEIAYSDILHVEDVPETVLLFGAKVVWVRRDAKIIRGRVLDAETFVQRRGGAPAPTGHVVERTEGRLRMQVRSRSTESDCHSPCSTCRGECSVCVSICRYHPPE